MSKLKIRERIGHLLSFVPAKADSSFELRHSCHPCHPRSLPLQRFNALTIQQRLLAATPNQLDAEFRRTDKGLMGIRKIMDIFLIGMLCGVMITAAFTYVFAIPANDYRWQMEIWNRGGAAFTSDKNGHFGWKWMVEPIPDTPSQKRVIAPPSAVKVRMEQL
jgi:hypothetical protein